MMHLVMIMAMEQGIKQNYRDSIDESLPSTHGFLSCFDFFGWLICTLRINTLASIKS